ncbi:MAG: RES family NAD+ phosphorylase [Rubrobacteraceae bacterium]
MGELNNARAVIAARAANGWRTYPAPPSLKAIGDAWLTEGRSLALRVPSVTVRGQHNYLINPAHPDFASVEVSDPEPLDLDPRLTGR